MTASRLFYAGRQGLLPIVETVAGRAGFQVEAFKGPQSLLAAALASVPEIVIVDLALPEGVECVRGLRTSRHSSRVSIIALGDSRTFQTALEAGADLIITRPVGAAELTECIASLARRAA